MTTADEWRGHVDTIKKELDRLRKRLIAANKGLRTAETALLEMISMHGEDPFVVEALAEVRAALRGKS